MAVYNEYVQKIESTVRRHVGDETSDTSEPTKVDVTVNFDAPGGEDAIGYYIIWDMMDSYPEELKRILYLSGVYDMNRGDNQGAAMAEMESMANLNNLFENLAKSIWPSKYSSDVDHGGYTEKGITATDGPEFVVLETAQGADDKYTQVGRGSYSNDEKAYILTALENAYGEASEYGKKYSLNDMQTAYWLSLGQNPGEKGTANGRTLYENAQKYAEFMQQGFSASIDSSLAQVIADRKNQSYIVGPFSLDYPDYTAEDISYVKSLSINNGELLYDETHEDFEIIFESEGTQVPGANGMKKPYPKAGEKFFIKFDAKKNKLCKKNKFKCRV